MANPTLRELGTFLGQFVPGAGVADAAGYYPASDKGYNPSLSDNWKAGNYGAASLQALGALADVIPGAGAGAKMSLAALGAVPALKTAAKVADAAAPEAKGIIAYHGSPHSFDRFDLSKIGTGEGAQAYGHGLYFADSEDVARSYRDVLSGKTETPERIAREWLNAAGTHADAADELMGSAALFKNPLTRAKYEEAARLLREGFDPSTVSDKGHMYQVRINADPEHFLDWDRPLSEQSPVVQQALQNRYGKYYDEMVRKNWTGDDVGARVEGPIQANEMAKAGLPGIRYLDQGSRSAGEGSRNYVVFDDKLIEIMKKYGLAGLGLGLPAFAAMNAQQQQNQTPGL